MKKTLCACAIAALVPLAAPVAAQGYIDSYRAYISRDDVVNSNGVRLRDVGAILRQDRANVHRYGIRQRGDEVDPYFGEPFLREMLQKAVNDSAIPGYIEEAIIYGNAMLTVRLYGEGDTLLYVDITMD